jgi:Tfp pilus assembly protein PilX
MRSAKLDSRGFTLIASLLLMLLLSGVAVSLLMMVNTEQKVGAADLSNNYTYRATEGAIEKQTSDLANTFKSIQSPTSAQICGVSANLPTWDPTVTYAAYNVAPVNPGVPNPCAAPLPPPVWGPIQSGPDAGLYAQIIPVTLNASAQRFNGETVSMTRTAEVALIPVFQFGVFCDGDCFFGRSPDLGFAGRVHTNGDLYLGVADGSNLVFGDKMAAFGNIIRQQMDNGVPSAGNNNGGTVMIPTTSNGCAAQMANVGAAVPSATCVDISTTALGATNGSVSGGHASAQVGAWYNVSLGVPYQGYIIDGNGTLPGTTNGPNGTGASDLTLPFVNGTTHPFEIIRRPPPGESVTSLLGGSRLANEAQIRVLLSDKQADLHLPGWNGDVTQDIQLASAVPNQVFNNAGAWAQNGIPVPAGGPNTYYFGESACGTTGGGSIGNVCTNGDANFIWPQWTPGGATSTHNVTKAEWPIVNGWLLVEVKWSADQLWHGVTKEWLQLGFARGIQVPTAPGTAAAQATNQLGATGSNFIADHKNAILYFQMTADRAGNGSITAADAVPFTSVAGAAVTTTPLINSSPGSLYSQYNWYPINFYDAREGENNDTSGFAATTGTVNGVMNAVELDTGNLKNWLRGLTGTPTGQNVDFATQNGYVLYFSDRRGMQYDPNAAHNPTNILLGAYGFEDVVNYAAGLPFSPNGALEPVNYNGVSPEDVEMWNDGAVTKYGAKTVGDAFGNQTATDTDVTNPPNPFLHRINTFTYGRANRVTGARHALKLVDGSLGNLPTMPPGNAINNCTQTAANPTGCGGFTVASENPVYVQGNYNSNCPVNIVATPNPCTPGNLNFDTAWGTPAEPIHAAASIIADAVTMLSNNWQDAGALGSTTNGSLLNPTNPGGQSVPAVTPNRIAVDSYYRVAVAGGKTIAFTNVAQNPEFSFGMDGGIHNFLRFLEDWGGVAAAGAQQSLYYKGSLVSLYWNTYATGTFKCCNLVYNPPNRQYTFDPLFSLPSNLPPGTPMFRNVDNLSYRQNQVARSN